MAKPRLLTDADTLENEFLFSTPQTASLQRGQNLVTAGDKSTPFNVLNIDGRTLVNLLGRDGNCEDISKWNTYQSTLALDTANYAYGSNSIKITVTAANGFNGQMAHYAPSTIINSSTDYYVILAEVKNGTISGTADLSFSDSYSSPITLDTSKFTLVYGKITGDLLTTHTNIQLRFFGNAANQYAYVDGFRLYQISQAEYNALGTTLTDANDIKAKYPYVDDMKHVQNPYLIKSGRNLLPPLQEWNLGDSTQDIISDSYSLTINPTASWKTSYYLMNALPNTQYTFGFIGSAVFAIGDEVNNALYQNFVNPTTNSTINKFTFTTNATSKQVMISISNGSATSGSYNATNIMLNLGSTALPFEPQNNDYLFLNTTLASNIDGTVKDYVYAKDGKYFKAKNFNADLLLDGNLSWINGTDYTGFKNVYCSLPTQKGVPDTSVVIKHDGKSVGRVLYGSPATSGDTHAFGSGTSIHIQVNDTDSGWGETYVPTNDEVKAYFWGWKMAPNSTSASSSYTGATGETKTWFVINGDGTYGGWTQNLPTVLALLSYKITYQIANEQEIAVQFEGDIQLHSGGNQIEYSEGVVIREKANPLQYNSNQWQINGGGVPNSKLKYAVGKPLTVYKNGLKDAKWVFDNTPYPNFGNWYLWENPSDYDPTAEYTVSYVVLQDGQFRSSVNSGSGAYNTNFRNVVNQISQEMTDLTTRQTATDVRLDKTFLKGLGERMEIITYSAPAMSPSQATEVGTMVFSRAFSSPPKIIACINSPQSYATNMTIMPNNITTTSMTAWIQNTSTTATIVAGSIIIFLVIGN